MKQMNKNLKTENFWILIIWLAVFMLVLSWDQEKIVVLNLVLFSYSLYYLVGQNIDTTLSQRRTILLENLLTDINAHLNTLNLLVSESKYFFSEYQILVLVITKKLFLHIQNLLLTQPPTINFFDIFYSIHFALHQLEDYVNNRSTEQNVFVSSTIITMGGNTLNFDDTLLVDIKK